MASKRQNLKFIEVTEYDWITLEEIRRLVVFQKTFENNGPGIVYGSVWFTGDREKMDLSREQTLSLVFAIDHKAARDLMHLYHYEP